MSYNTYLKTLALCLGVIVVAFSISYFVFGAWTEPASTPPLGNAPAPINVGTTTQLKLGGLGINGIFVVYGGAANETLVVTNGKVGIGTTTPNYDLEVKGMALVTDNVCLANGICLSNCSATACSGDCSRYLPGTGCVPKLAGDYDLSYCKTCDGVHTTSQFYAAGTIDNDGYNVCNRAHQRCDGAGHCVEPVQDVCVYAVSSYCSTICALQPNCFSCLDGWREPSLPPGGCGLGMRGGCSDPASWYCLCRCYVY